MYAAAHANRGDGLLPNWPVDVRDIKIAEEIFEPDFDHVESRRVVAVPDHVTGHYQDITIAADVMFVNGIPFYITISRNIKFGTAEAIQNKKPTTIMTAVEPVRQIYLRRGFRIAHLLWMASLIPSMVRFLPSRSL
jgi:hypothetical protein